MQHLPWKPIGVFPSFHSDYYDIFENNHTERFLKPGAVWGVGGWRTQQKSARACEELP